MARLPSGQSLGPAHQGPARFGGTRVAPSSHMRHGRPPCGSPATALGAKVCSPRRRCCEVPGVLRRAGGGRAGRSSFPPRASWRGARACPAGRRVRGSGRPRRKWSPPGPGFGVPCLVYPGFSRRQGELNDSARNRSLLSSSVLVGGEGEHADVQGAGVGWGLLCRAAVFQE